MADQTGESFSQSENQLDSGAGPRSGGTIYFGGQTFTGGGGGFTYQMRGIQSAAYVYWTNTTGDSTGSPSGPPVTEIMQLSKQQSA